MPFNYRCSLPVIVWLLLVLTNIAGIRGNQTVLEGDNLHLTCIASGRPEPNITWIKERPGNQGNTVVVQEGKVLTITNINRTYALSLYTLFSVFYHVQSFTFINVWWSTSMLGSKHNFSKNHPLATFNCKLVTIKNFGCNPLPFPYTNLIDPLMIKRLYIYRWNYDFWKGKQFTSCNLLRRNNKTCLIQFLSIAQLRNISNV